MLVYQRVDWSLSGFPAPNHIFLAFPRPMNLHDRLLQGLPIDCDPFKMLAGSADWFYLVTCVLLLEQDAGPPCFFVIPFTMF